MSHTHHFQFTIGPVQGFVAQARRTRDFWAGSFILSWLTGVAMAATIKQGGKIVFPTPDQDFLDAITGKLQGKEKPTQGTLPNRFKAEVAANFDPKAVTSALNGAWQALAKTVYDADLTKFANAQTKAIWDRQVTGFFETSWAMSDINDNLPVIDLRKNWRSHYPQAEAGHKCSLMEGWQELSGVAGYHAADNKARKAFWVQVRKQSGFGRDLVDNEHLCAMAFIKRRFAHYFEKVNSNGFHGWKLNPNNVPSVALLAALPAINLIKETGEAAYSAFKDFSQKWEACGGEFGERRSLPASIADIKALGLDGIAWFYNTYDNPSTSGLEAEKARAAKQSLKALYDDCDVREPSPFYAILMMDGDSLGKQMSDTTKQEAISQGLNAFTKGVKTIVEDHNGFLIYAGGDDVLSILPIDTALTCAKVLREHYIDSFKKLDNQEITTSISAAVIFSHIKTSLSRVLHDAHHVLDDAAKDGAGRDALAVQVIKNSGKHLLWAMPWNQALDKEGHIIVQTLADELRGTTRNDGFYNPENLEASTKFFYGFREHFARLVDTNKPYDAATAELITDLLAVDYKQSGVSKDKVKSINDAKKQIKGLVEQCTPHKRMNEVNVSELNKADINKTGAPQIDGALLVRFLAFRGQDRT
jgi:CRISPR-associated protein Cmr2